MNPYNHRLGNNVRLRSQVQIGWLKWDASQLRKMPIHGTYYLHSCLEPCDVSAVKDGVVQGEGYLYNVLHPSSSFKEVQYVQDIYKCLRSAERDKYSITMCYNNTCQYPVALNLCLLSHSVTPFTSVISDEVCKGNNLRKSSSHRMVEDSVCCRSPFPPKNQGS